MLALTRILLDASQELGIQSHWTGAKIQQTQLYFVETKSKDPIVKYM